MRMNRWKKRLAILGALLGGTAALANAAGTELTGSDLMPGALVDVVLGAILISAIGALIGAGVDRLGPSTNGHAPTDENRSDQSADGQREHDVSSLADLFVDGAITKEEFVDAANRFTGVRASSSETVPSRSGAKQLTVIASIASVCVLAVVGLVALQGKEAETGDVPLPNDRPLPAYTNLTTDGFSVRLRECGNPASGTVLNLGKNRALVTVAVDFFNSERVRLGGWFQSLDGVDPGRTATWEVYLPRNGEVAFCEAEVSMASVTP
jgi:hypothetical protein